MPLKYSIPHPVVVVFGGTAVPAVQMGGQPVAQQRQRVGAQPLMAGPPELNVPYWLQLGDEWCWAASAQMVLAFLDAPTPPPLQCELANLLLDLGIDCCGTALPVPD